LISNAGGKITHQKAVCRTQELVTETQSSCLNAARRDETLGFSLSCFYALIHAQSCGWSKWWLQTPVRAQQAVSIQQYLKSQQFDPPSSAICSAICASSHPAIKITKINLPFASLSLKLSHALQAFCAHLVADLWQVV